jgi:hypothetical protein
LGYTLLHSKVSGLAESSQIARTINSDTRPDQEVRIAGDKEAAKHLQKGTFYLLLDFVAIVWECGSLR